MLCRPAESAEVVKVATPLVAVTLAKRVVPSKKFTVPVALVLLTVAVRVTLDW